MLIFLVPEGKYKVTKLHCPEFEDPNSLIVVLVDDNSSEMQPSNSVDGRNPNIVSIFWFFYIFLMIFVECQKDMRHSSCASVTSASASMVFW